MLLQTKYNIGETIKFHPFGKMDLTNTAKIQRINITAKKISTSTEYVVEDKRGVVWSVYENSVVGVTV
jgi:hypothetical protein